MSINKRIFSIFFAVAFFMVSSIACAEIMTYEGTGEYVMSDFETPDIAKQRAKVRAEQNAAEQAGVYVQSYTRTVNSIVATDEVTAIANTIIKIVDEKYTIIPSNESGGSFLVKVKIKANVDSTNIDAWLKNEHQQNILLVEQNKKLWEEREEQNREIKKLREKIKNTTNDQEKRPLEKAFINEDRKFLSLQKSEKGDRFFVEKKYSEAINMYSEAIGLNNENYVAYIGRGNAYTNLGNIKQGLLDYNKAIEKNPKSYVAYLNRGLLYLMDGAKDQAINDFNRGININPRFSIAYVMRGMVYMNKKNDELAMLDFTKAIELNPREASAYSARGAIYSSHGKYHQALGECNKAIEVDGKNIMNYIQRGVVYSNIGKYQQAIEDYSRVININPNYAYAYYCRGIQYRNLGNINKAREDFSKARKLGFKAD